MQELITAHAKELAEVQAYHNGVTYGHLDQIKALKAELAEARRARAAAEKVAAETAAENKRLVEPLAQVMAAAWRFTHLCSSWQEFGYPSGAGKHLCRMLDSIVKGMRDAMGCRGGHEHSNEDACRVVYCGHG